MSKFITLRMSVPATIYPTLTVNQTDWEEALNRAKQGQATVLEGFTGGHGCRGGRLPSHTESVTVVRAFTESECSEWHVVAGVFATHPGWDEEVVLYPGYQAESSDDAVYID